MEKKKNTKKIIGTVVDVLIWVLVVLCVGVSIVAVSAGTNAKNVPTVGDTCFLNVKTESMDAEKPAGVPADKPAGFSAGTMLLSKYIAEDDAAIDALEVGDIITFEMKLDGSDTVDYNTHRIVAVERNENGTLVSVTTKGDNNDLADGGLYGDLIVAGFDAGAPQKEAVRNGWFVGSVTQDPYRIGYLAVELAVKAANGEEVADVDTGAQWYTAENIDDPEIAMLVYD